MDRPELVLEVDNNSTSITSGKLTKEEYKELKRALGYKVENLHWVIRSKVAAAKPGEKESVQRRMEEWDGYYSSICYNSYHCKCAVNKSCTHFPSGVLGKARQFFNSYGIPYRLIDVRQPVSPIAGFSMSDAFQYRDYQAKIRDDACNRKRGIIKVATGGGKTSIAASIIAELGMVPMIFYVTSCDLLAQAKEEFEKFIWFNGLPLEVGQVGGGKKEIRDVTVMTVQTAVRCLGGVYVKFDEEDKAKDNTEIDDIKKEVVDLIRSAKCIICDEVQHWASETAQIISDNSFSAYYRYGCSATPWRDKGDDILIEACFGRTLADIDASFLIRRGYLIKPTIYFVGVDNIKSTYKSYQKIYKHALKENTDRNLCISNLAKRFEEEGRQSLILVNHIDHGNALKSIIPGSVFLHGSKSAKVRKAHLEKMRNRECGVTIASSLPYDEMVLIKEQGFIKHISIGELCENYTINNDIKVACSFDGKTMSWGKITQFHKHKRQNDVMKVRTNKNEEILVTENHSLVDCDLCQVKPSIGGNASSPQIVDHKFVENKIKKIDLKEIFANFDDDSIEVEVLNMNQPLMRKINSEYKYLDNPKNVSKSTRWAIRKRLKNKDEDYCLAVKQFKMNFKYYKKKYRAKLKDVYQCKELWRYFEGRIFIRRSRKSISLPLELDVNNDLAKLCGILCAEGHIRNNKKHQSRFDVVFAGLEDMSESHEGEHDVNKKEIRNTFVELVRKIFHFNPIVSNKQVKISGKLMYYLFKGLKLVSSNSDLEKRIPDFIFNADYSVQDSFIYGFYLGDGSKKLDYRPGFKKSDVFTAINLTNSSRALISGVVMLLKIMQKKFYIYIQEEFENTKQRFNVSVADDVDNLRVTRKVDRIDFRMPQREQKMVVEAEEEYQNKFVYDISVDGCHNFVAGMGILAHNSIFDEGVDVKPLDTLILAGAGKSPTRALQRVGRVLRPFTFPSGEEKKDAVVVDLWDQVKYLKDHGAARRKIYEREEEFAIKDIGMS